MVSWTWHATGEHIRRLRTACDLVGLNAFFAFPLRAPTETVERLLAGVDFSIMKVSNRWEVPQRAVSGTAAGERQMFTPNRPFCGDPLQQTHLGSRASSCSTLR